MNLNRTHWKVFNGLVIPEWLIEQSLCETNKVMVNSVDINRFVRMEVLPIVLGVVNHSLDLEVTSNHVHIGGEGLTSHDHQPHVMSSVLYLLSSTGALVLDHGDDWVPIEPVAGRLVIFPANVTHYVQPSNKPGLRLALVTNYGNS